LFKPAPVSKRAKPARCVACAGLGHVLALAAAMAASAPAAAGDLRGIYVDSVAFPITAESEARLDQALRQDGVDGLMLVLGWSSIEPERGSYQWMRPADPQWLDQWIGKAIAAGKKVELSVRSDKTPDWLHAAGVRTLPFTYAAQGGTKPCRTEMLAVPWDAGFLREWDAMLAALSAHLKAAVVQGVSE
jgi:hypothetical protein